MDLGEAWLWVTWEEMAALRAVGVEIRADEPSASAPRWYVRRSDKALVLAMRAERFQRPKSIGRMRMPTRALVAVLWGALEATDPARAAGRRSSWMPAEGGLAGRCCSPLRRSRHPRRRRSLGLAPPLGGSLDSRWTGDDHHMGVVMLDLQEAELATLEALEAHGDLHARIAVAAWRLGRTPL